MVPIKRKRSFIQLTFQIPLQQNLQMKLTDPFWRITFPSALLYYRLEYFHCYRITLPSGNNCHLTLEYRNQLAFVYQFTIRITSYGHQNEYTGNITRKRQSDQKPARNLGNVIPIGKRNYSKLQNIVF